MAEPASPWEIIARSSYSRIEQKAKLARDGKTKIKILLKANGKVYENWKSIRITKSLTDFAGSFNFAIFNASPYKPENWDLRIGDACTVEINDQQIIKGYIDEMPIKYDASSHAIGAAGRDITGDLVDCTHLTPNEVTSDTLENIVTMICDPFGIDVVIDPSASTPAATRVKFVADVGETAHELIARHCRYLAVLPVCYGDGKLTLTRAGSERTTDALKLGVNVKAGDANWSDMERFSNYYVKAQGEASKDFPWESTMTNVSGESSDSVLTERGRHRPLVVFMEKEATDTQCQNRANWEALARAALSRSLTYTVQGWTQSNGVVWPLNRVVDIEDGILGIKGARLISGLSFELDQNRGSITKITVVRKDAFELTEEPVPEEDADLFDKLLNEKIK